MVTVKLTVKIGRKSGAEFSAVTSDVTIGHDEIGFYLWCERWVINGVRTGSRLIRPEMIQDVAFNH